MHAMNEISGKNGTVADAVKGHWVDTVAPSWLRPFARLARWDRPIGWWLLLLPCWWSTAIADDMAGQPPSYWIYVYFMIGAIAMRGAGCTYNDLIDRDLDAQVARTKSRPLPSGQVSVNQAKLFLIVQAAAGLLVLSQFNTFAIVLGLCSLPIVAIYPFMKRIFNWPQLVLGLAFSWGGLMGYAAVFGSLNSAVPFLVYGASVLWTIGYDTIYAHQDQEDDELIGIRSTARTFGTHSKVLIGLLFGSVVLLSAVAVFSASSGLFALLGLAAFSVHLVWQVITLQPDDGNKCLMLFRANRDAGLLFFVGLLLQIYI